MNASNLNAVDQFKAFLEGSQPIAFAVAGNKHDRYRWIGNTLSSDIDSLVGNIGACWSSIQ